MNSWQGAAGQNPVRLNEGITRGNLRALYGLSFITMALLAFITLNLDFVLRTFLQIPLAEQGRVAGRLQAGRELVVLFAISFGGILSDTLGRRPVFIGGYAILATAFLAFPFAKSEAAFLPAFLLAGVGAAFLTAMLQIVLADYVKNEDRGRAAGIQGVMVGLAIFIVFPLKLLPQKLAERGFDIATAGMICYGMVAAMAVVAAVAAFLFLARTTVSREVKPPFATLLRQGVLAAKDPGIALSYLAAFVSRGDLAVVGTFLTLWVSRAAAQAGLDAAQSGAAAGGILLVGGIAQLVSAPFLGRITDRLDRFQALALAAMIAVAGYGGALLISDPLGPGLKALMILIGVAQIAGVITSQVLVAERAPEDRRGSVIGFFGLCGAFAIMSISYVGGRLFDSWREAGPFALVAVLNLGLAAAAFWVRKLLADRAAR